MIEYRLKIGRKQTGCIVRQDDEYPQLYRIHYKGQISDIVNLSRAKDAGITWVRPRGLGSTEVAKWERRETAVA
jgi:hypothetical protein